MSFIREVIGLVNQNECVDSHQTIRILVEEIKNFQYKIKTYIDNNYVNFLPNLENNRMILDEGQRLYLAIESLHENISNDKQRDLSRLDDELSHAMEELEEVALGLKTSNKILQIDDLFGAIEIAKNSGECLKVMAYTSEMHYLIYDKEDEVLPHLDCFENIKIKYQIEHETMMFNLKRQFNSLVQLTEKKFQKTKSVSIKITKDDNKLHETIVALINSNFNSNQIANFLMENVFEPIVTKPISIQFFEENCGFAELILSYSLQPMGNDLRPNYRVVFDHIKTAFMCLGYMNISISPDVCMFGIIANLIKDKFLRLLRDNCLLESIPNTMDEMHESTLVDDLLEFDEFLCRMLFLNEKTDTELRDFAGRVEMLFKNRFCSNILESAVAIMRHDLHDMVLMADLVNPIKEEEGSTACLGAAAFPRCMISKSTLVSIFFVPFEIRILVIYVFVAPKELVNLMDKVLRRSESAQDELTNRLLSTIPTIIDRYITEVPSSHAKLLLNIPQQTALFHNNCMYLAYWLTMNAAKCNEPTATLVKSLHTCGNEHFLRQSTNQREQLMDILKEFGT